MSLAGNWLARTWRTRGWAACALWPLSMLYAALAGLHRWLYKARILKTERVAVPVIVVGNVVAGGAGKTPLVIALAQHLQRRGLQVGVVSRGYGRQGKHSLEVVTSTSISESGDEPAYILHTLAAPVFVANTRVDAANALLAKYPHTQVIFSDDGLQHHALARDVEIIAFDDRGIGNGWQLPAGPLRESWPAQRTPRLVLHTGQSPAFGGFASSRRLADYAVARDGSRVALTDLQRQPIAALAGIANPQAFFEMLMARGLQLAHTVSLPDHFDFLNYTLPSMPAATVLCTEKDAIKLFRLPMNAAVKLLAVPLEFTPEPAFLAAVDHLLEPLLGQAVLNSTPSTRAV